MLFKRPLSLLLILTCLILSLPLVADLNISSRVLDKIEAQYNKFARKRVEDWQKLVAENKDLPEAEKLELVNQFFNTNVLFIDDIDLWNKKDYWATPLEMLSIGGGDCEDYSIAKYFTLKELGVDEDKLRITYVKAKELNQAHMVLTYFKTKRSVPLVLDNLITDIKPATQRNDLTPVYSFNGTGLWLAKSRGEGQRVGGSSRLSLWQDLEKRMQKQAEEATSE
ncbi:MAG: sulfate adenylyltransferase [Methylophaga sp.]|uniref:transglutaminase-like cysteine peptidase n=1 Tax=Methylophaga sp. UBA678 TaxID=1946901 RepID=UPI000C665FDA|nr:transglutaminase-like cysteine peptidase [Methylophaga sp. UBA678]MAX50437.1 sulfate adenylyltransferase [Methylophaga sp.]|tara:strand:+ start:16280 stop:16951 length:672 start_codon:yes stop_codon:yes gene_type:complete